MKDSERPGGPVDTLPAPLAEERVCPDALGSGLGPLRRLQPVGPGDPRFPFPSPTGFFLSFLFSSLSLWRGCCWRIRGASLVRPGESKTAAVIARYCVCSPSECGPPAGGQALPGI